MSVYSCQVKGCSSVNLKPLSYEFNCSLFPKNPDVLKKWIKLIGLPRNWKPDEHSVVCAEHFHQSTFIMRPNGVRRKLRHWSVPQINLSESFKLPKAEENAMKRSHSNTTHLEFIGNKPVIKLRRIDEIIGSKSSVNLSQLSLTEIERNIAGETYSRHDTTVSKITVKKMPTFVERSNLEKGMPSTSRSKRISEKIPTNPLKTYVPVGKEKVNHPATETSPIPQSRRKQSLEKRNLLADQRADANQRLITQPNPVSTTSTSKTLKKKVQAKRAVSLSVGEEQMTPNNKKLRSGDKPANPLVAPLDTSGSRVDSGNTPAVSILVKQFLLAAPKVTSTSPHSQNTLTAPKSNVHHVTLPRPRLDVTSDSDDLTEQQERSVIDPLKRWKASAYRRNRKANELGLNGVLHQVEKPCKKSGIKPKSLYVLRNDLPENLKHVHQSKIWVKTHDESTLLIRVLDSPPVDVSVNNPPVVVSVNNPPVVVNNAPKVVHPAPPVNIPPKPCAIKDTNGRTLLSCNEYGSDNAFASGSSVSTFCESVLLEPNECCPVPSTAAVPAKQYKTCPHAKKRVNVPPLSTIHPAMSRSAEKLQYLKEAFYHDHMYFVGTPVIKRFSDENIIKLENDVMELKYALSLAKAEVASLKKVVKLKSDRISALNRMHNLTRMDPMDPLPLPSFEEVVMPNVFGQHFMAPLISPTRVKEEPL